MNIRKASDFYHSIPLSKTCVYLTYTVTALIWSIVTVVVSTLLSFTIYALSLKTVINIEFIWPTIISSIILAMLVASIALLAKRSFRDYIYKYYYNSYNNVLAKSYNSLVYNSNKYIS